MSRHTKVVPLKPSGYFIYHQFDNKKIFIPPTQCICSAGISLKNSIKLLVFISETECVYSAVRTEALSIIRFRFSLGRVKYHSMKKYMHGGISSRILNLGTKWELLNFGSVSFIHRKIAFHSLFA